MTAAPLTANPALRAVRPAATAPAPADTPDPPAPLRRLRWAVRATLTLGVAASVAANILHAEPNPISQIIAGWPPLALLLTVELISRVPTHQRSLAVIRLVATTAIAGIAAWVSYWHMVGVAARYGETDAASYLLPLSVDGLVIVASVSLVEITGRLRAGLDRQAAPLTSPRAEDPAPSASPAGTPPGMTRPDPMTHVRSGEPPPVAEQASYPVDDAAIAQGRHSPGPGSPTAEPTPNRRAPEATAAHRVDASAAGGDRTSTTPTTVEPAADDTTGEKLGDARPRLVDPAITEGARRDPSEPPTGLANPDADASVGPTADDLVASARHAGVSSDDHDAVPPDTAAAVAYWYRREPRLHPAQIAARIGRSERTVRRYWPPTTSPGGHSAAGRGVQYPGARG